MRPGTKTTKARGAVLGANAGRAEFDAWLADAGIELSATAYEKAFLQLRKTVDSQGEVAGSQLQAIVDDVVADMEVFEGVAASFRAFR